MEEEQSTNGNSEPVLYEDVLDEDETRLIIDEGCLPSEENREKYGVEQKPRLLKLKSKKDVQETANTYPCPDCCKTFRRKVKLQAHLLTHRPKEELECENCGRKFRKVDSLFSHVCSGFGNSYKCSECDEWFRLKRDLVVHRQSHKQTSAPDESLDEKDPAEEIDFSSFVSSFVKWPVTCTRCGDKLVNLQNYNIHMAAHKKGEPCYCINCKTKFSCKDDYLLHKDLCPIEGIFECTYCSKKFHTEKKLSDHLESHSLEGVCCDICRLRFPNKEKLALHMRVHNISIFVCAKCKKIFRCNISLKNHTCVPENEKKLYKFDDYAEKIMNEQCQDSWSAIEDSDSEDAELCKVLSESNFCKVCGDVFQDREGLTSHLGTHFQCVECKKYFKSQTDLDMHTFLLAEEKLYSCCLCEAVVHGKKELECHLSSHLTSDDDLFDDLESEDNTEILQNIIGSVDATESLQSTSVESSLSSVKIHKVTPAGKNALKCSSCGKFVFSHHNLSAHIEPSTPTGDSDDEYVYISRLGSPQNKPKQAEETYCSCHYSSGSSLGSLIEQSPGPSKSPSECGDQEAQKIFTTQTPIHLSTPKRKIEESDSKSKLFLSEVPKDSSFVLLDGSNKSSNNSDAPNGFEASKPETEANCRVVLNSTRLPEKDSSGSASSFTDFGTKKDYKNTSDHSKSSLPNVELEGKKEVTSPKRLGIRVIKLDNNKVEVESSPPRMDTKGLVSNSNTGNGNVHTKPLRIFVTTSGLLPLPTNNVGKELGLVSELPIDDKKKSTSGQNSSGFRKILPKVNVISQDHLVLPPLKREDNGKSSQNNPASGPKKIILKKSFKKMSFSELRGVKKIEMVSSKPNKNTLKTSNTKLINFETKSHNTVGQKSITVGLQGLDPSCGISEVEANLIRKSKAFGKTQPVVLKINDKNIKSGNRRTHFKNREHQEKKMRSNSSTLNANDNESCCNPEANIILKVEKLNYDSDEDDEDESLDFSGIKKEFLASDVFIKEEWDIVDF